METSRHTKKTPCPHHGRQGAKLGGPDVRRRRQRGRSCGLFLALVSGLVEGLSERFVVQDDARGHATHGPIADLLNGKAVVTGNLGGATHACDS